MTLTDDVLYVSNIDRVQAFEPESGELLWTWFPGDEPSTSTGFYAAPVVDLERGFLMVAGFDNQTAYALRLGESPEDLPALVWSFPGAGEEEGANGQYVSAGALAGSLFLVGNGDGSLYALSLENGSLVWSFPTEDRIWSTPLVVDDVVYVTSLDKHIYALNLSDGSLIWRTPTRGAIAASPVLVDGSLWFGDFGDRIYQVDPDSGAILWTFEGGEDWFWATPAVDGDRLYFADVRGGVYAFDAGARELLWQTELDAVFHGRPALGPEGEVLFVPAYKSGRIHPLATSDGHALQWQQPTDPGRLPSSLVADGERVYARPILVEPWVQAFDQDNGQLVWEYAPED
jgi:outer membrane protein assembly factor BamB